MKKYWTIINNEFQRQFTYRANILAFVLGNFVNLISLVVVWYAAYRSVESVGGYSFREMMTYVVVGWVILFMTNNYGFESIVSRDILLGTMSNFLTKPISYLRYTFARSIGRVMVAFMVVILQSVAYILLFHGFLVFRLDFFGSIVFCLMLAMSFVIKIFFAILVGLIAFWTIDVSGVQTAANVIIRFFSGAYFPVNLLPAAFVNVSLALPFVYTHYVPTQFFIGKIDLRGALYGVLVQFIWLIILYIIVKYIWKIGLKKYESVGI